MIFSASFPLILLFQLCNATPDPSVVASDNAAPQGTIPLPELYGVNGTFGADELYYNIMWYSTTHYNVVIEDYSNILWGFLKCNPEWIKSWFADPDEQDRLNKTRPLGEDETYMLRYDPKDNMRHPVAVSPRWLMAGYLTDKDRSFASSLKSLYNSWWTWGLLQGAYNGTRMGLDMYELVSAISGETMQELRTDDWVEYWNLFTQAHRSPMWIWDVSSRCYWTVMNTTGTGPQDGWFLTETIGPGYGQSRQSQKFSDWNTTTMSSPWPNQVFFLQGVPDFGDGKRKGEIKY